MRITGIALIIGFALWIAPTGVLAQDIHDHSGEQATPEQSNASTPATGAQNMMGQMATSHQDMDALMKKLMESMAEIRAEKDPAALKNRLADHAALLEQMRTKMMQASDMMKMISGMGMNMMPGMMDGSKKGELKTNPDSTPNDSDHSAHQH